MAAKNLKRVVISRFVFLAAVLGIFGSAGVDAREVEYSPPTVQNPMFMDFARSTAAKIDFLIEGLNVPELAYVAVQEPGGRAFLFEYLQPGEALGSWRRLVSVNSMLIGDTEETAKQNIGRFIDMFIAQQGPALKLRNQQRQELPWGQGFYAEFTVGEGAIAEDTAMVIRKQGTLALVIMNQKRGGKLTDAEKFATQAVLAVHSEPRAP